MVHRGRIENLLTARRVLKIAAILLVFLVSASILVASVIYDLAATNIEKFTALPSQYGLRLLISHIWVIPCEKSENNRTNFFWDF